jgi:hypothetical protein
MLVEELRALRQEVAALREENHDIKEHLKRQEQFNKILVEQLQQNFQQIERGSLERHKQLTQSLKESMEYRKLLAAVIEEENQKTKRKGLFRFLSKLPLFKKKKPPEMAARSSNKASYLK